MALSSMFMRLAVLFLLPLAYVVMSFGYQVIYYRFFHLLRNFPGPFWASVTRLWITYHNIKGDEPQTFQALHQKYGKHITEIRARKETSMTVAKPISPQAPSSASPPRCSSSAMRPSCRTCTVGRSTSHSTTSPGASARRRVCSTCRIPNNTHSFAR